jgi:hypothetical protein
MKHNAGPTAAGEASRSANKIWLNFGRNWGHHICCFGGFLLEFILHELVLDLIGGCGTEKSPAIVLEFTPPLRVSLRSV